MASFRILYAGPGLSGRTTTITQICQRAPKSVRASRMRLDHRSRWAAEATLTWETHTPLTITLFATPGSLWYNPLYEEAAAIADGIVFVVDSQVGRLEASIESIERNTEWLRNAGRDIRDLPVALQYNKRDRRSVGSIEQLERELNVADWPHFETIAPTGFGIFGPLHSVADRLAGIHVERLV